MVSLIMAATVHKGVDRKQLRISRFGLLFIAALVFFSSAFAGCGGGVSTTNEQPLSVTQATGSASLAWDAPTTYVDGAPLTPAGYIVHYGVSSGQYAFFKVIPSNVNSYQVTGLMPGRTYYFVVTSFDTPGIESDYSNELSKFVN